MRLIDADVLIEAMKKTEEEFENAMTCPSWWSAYNVIKEQPIAFDKEKVVKQLLDMRLIRVEQCHGDYEIEVITENNFDDAIDIVKRGGIE